MINLCHLTPTPFLNESRVKKQVYSMSKDKNILKIYVLALNKKNLPKFETISDKASLHRITLLSRFLPRLIFFQTIKYFELIIRIIFFVIKNKVKFIVIHSLSLLPIGWLLKIFFNAKIIYDCHELETEAFGLKGFRKNISKLTEKFFIRYVDLVVVVSKGIHNWYEKEYNLKKIITVRNTPLKKLVNKSNYFREKYKISSENTIILYLGGLFKGRSINQLISIFEEINASNLFLVFMGYGEMEEFIKQKSKNNKNIFLHKAVETNQILEIASSADIGIAYLNNGSLNDNLCLPNKFFEYIFSGLPVITSNSPDMVDIINKYNIGITISKLNKENLLKAINKIKNLNHNILKESLFSAAIDLSWDSEEVILLNGYKSLINKKVK